MVDINNTMRLQAGQVIYAGDIPIKPLTLGEIAEIGYTNFQQAISMLSLSVDDMIDAIDTSEREGFELQAQLTSVKHQFTSFDLYMISNDMREVVVDSLKLLFRTDDIVINEDSFDDIKIIISDKYVISRDNYGDVINVINMQNDPKLSGKTDEEGFKPSNETARRIAEKLEKSKKRVEESKALESDGEGLTLTDVISSVSAMSNSINKLNIWDLTIYQLYDEFARLSKIDNYRLQIQASMWSSDIEIEHWSEPY